MSIASSFTLDLEHKQYTVVITDDDALELYVDGCLRKRREPSSKEPSYVWTNIELNWEEHRYVEVRFFRTLRDLKVTVNGDSVFETNLRSRLVDNPEAEK